MKRLSLWIRGSWWGEYFDNSLHLERHSWLKSLVWLPYRSLIVLSKAIKNIRFSSLTLFVIVASWIILVVKNIFCKGQDMILYVYSYNSILLFRTQNWTNISHAIMTNLDRALVEYLVKTIVAWKMLSY